MYSWRMHTRIHQQSRVSSFNVHYRCIHMLKESHSCVHTNTNRHFHPRLYFFKQRQMCFFRAVAFVKLWLRALFSVTCTVIPDLSVPHIRTGASFSTVPFTLLLFKQALFQGCWFILVGSCWFLFKYICWPYVSIFSPWPSCKDTKRVWIASCGCLCWGNAPALRAEGIGMAVIARGFQ